MDVFLLILLRLAQRLNFIIVEPPWKDKPYFVFARYSELLFGAAHNSLLYGNTPCMRKDYLIKSITQYIFFFFLGAFLGYLWEVLLFMCRMGFSVTVAFSMVHGFRSMVWGLS